MTRRLLSSDASLLLISAPAGYGKSTLLRQYADRDPRPSAWLCLDEADNDADVFLGRLAKAVAGIGSREPAAAPLGGAGLSLPALLRLVSTFRVPFLLVLDDVQCLRSAGALDILATVSRSVPRETRLAIASRTRPDIGLGRLRALGRVLEIGAMDLAFTASETASLMRALGPRLRGEEVAHLLSCTEGWVTGLNLAAQSVRAGGWNASGFTGDDPLITDYLWDEPLRKLPEPIIEFLIRSSVLQRLTGTACDSVLRMKGSGTLLRDLSRSNLFLFSLDRHQRTYRYHRLFSEALRAELHRRDPDLEVELNRRASSWCKSQGRIDEAIGYAIAGGDVPNAAQLIWAEISPAGSPRPETLEQWLSAFSERETTAHPPLALATAWLFAERGDGDGTDKWASVAERSYFRGRLPGGPTNLGAAVRLMRARLGREGIARMTEDASQAYALDADQGPWRGAARYFEGMGLLLQGNRESGRRALEECERRCRWSIQQTHTECLAQLALIAVEEGEDARCRQLAQRAQDQVDELHLQGRPVPAIVHALLALTGAQAGDHLSATAHLRDAEGALARYSRFATWLEVECRIVMARANLALSDGAAARRLLATARRVLREISDATMLDRWIDELTQALREFPVSSQGGGASLTEAELRVLHRLPTHLTFPEIGDRLCVSRHTVKSQALSIYRKLGVGSRAEAVERARVLGLLEASV